MAEGWDLVGQVRTDVADLVEALTDEQRNGPTLCAGWSPHVVLGHLTGFVEVGLPSFFFNIVRNGFNFDKAADRSARKMAERSVEDLAATLRRKATKKSAVSSFPPELTLADVAVHTQDIRRGQNLPGALDENVVRTSLDFVTTHKQGKLIAAVDKMDGLSFRATDIDWSHGSGEEVSGPAEALLLALCGRPVFDELEGPVDRLEA